MECGPSGQGEKPEPQENVDFLIDDIDGQNAQVISSLHGTGRTIFVKSTFGHLREYLSRKQCLRPLKTTIFLRWDKQNHLQILS